MPNVFKNYTFKIIVTYPRGECVNLRSCGLYEQTECGWQHLPITWTNVDFSLVRFCGIHLRAISLWVLKLLFCIMSLKSILLRLLPHLPGASEINPGYCLNIKALFTNMGIPIIKIRQSGSYLILIMGIPIPGKMVFCIETGPSCLYQRIKTT